MALTEEKKTTKNVIQNIVLESREKLKVTGVLDVECFNEEIIIALTELGRLHIHGSNLKVNKLNLDNAELCIEGYVNSMEYAEKKKTKRSVFGRRDHV